MAKKSVSTAPASTEKAKPTATKGKPALPKASPAPKTKPAAAKPVAGGAPSLGSEAIGEAAGGVWKALHDGGELTLAALKKASGAPPDLALMAVGWLAREGKLEFTTSGKSVKVSLRG